jgi:hypothetical protein
MSSVIDPNQADLCGGSEYRPCDLLLINSAGVDVEGVIDVIMFVV